MDKNDGYLYDLLQWMIIIGFHCKCTLPIIFKSQYQALGIAAGSPSRTGARPIWEFAEGPDVTTV
jgi:hypothetical protein